MAVACRQICPIIILTLCLMCNNMIVEGNEPLVTVHVSIDMPAPSPCLYVTWVNCTGMWYKLTPGEEFHFTDDRTSRYVCHAMWRDKEGIWLAFESVRDRNHTKVFSSLREDGFFLSYDQSNWSKLSEWHV